MDNGGAHLSPHAAAMRDSACVQCVPFWQSDDRSGSMRRADHLIRRHLIRPGYQKIPLKINKIVNNLRTHECQINKFLY